MFSLITSKCHSTLSPHFVPNPNNQLSSSSHAFVINNKRRLLNLRKLQLLPSYFAGFVVLKSRSCASTCCFGDGELELEAEILNFVKKSDKPDSFPSKRELVDGGRIDLVEAIKKKGGWWSLGWESDDEKEDNVVEKRVQESEIIAIDCDFQDFLRRVEGFREISTLEDVKEEVGSSGFSFFSTASSESTSSSSRPIEIGAEEDTGIEGILSRLDKERNLSFGITLGKGNGSCRMSMIDEGGTHFGASSNVDRADLGKSCNLESNSHNNGIYSNSDEKRSQSELHSDLDGLGNSVKPEMWRTWSIQRAGYSYADFEAAEISYDENGLGGEKDAWKVDAIAITEYTRDSLDQQKEINHKQIRTLLQHLELELSSALRSLRSKSAEFISKEDPANSPSDLQKLSDAWEFQENELMNAQGRLRSMRAKLAVLEGKMSLAIIDAQKRAEEKQKKIDGACKALQILQTACIVWPNSASEVLLAGSFDGWTNQRKLEKSTTGIFSVCLKLYPGRYEIKFIVDGKWKIDPLRPIVKSNGYENNLLIIT